MDYGRGASICKSAAEKRSGAECCGEANRCEGCYECVQRLQDFHWRLHVLRTGKNVLPRKVMKKLTGSQKIVPAYGYAFFAPGIIRSYGYSPIQTQLHSVPPWAAAFTFAMLIAYISDKTKHRFLFTITPIAVTIAGFAILITVHHNHRLEYGALFLVAMGSFSAMPVIICWFTMNLGGHHRRSVGTAWQVGFGNIGGIIATYAFLAKDAPKYYKPGYSICIAFVCLSAAACMCYLAAVWTQNRNRDRAPRDLGLTEYEKTEKGDLSPNYRYLI